MKDVGGLITAIEQIFSVFSVTAVLPELYRPFFAFVDSIGKIVKSEIGVPYMVKFTEDRIHERMDNVHKQPPIAKDQMTLFVKKHNKDPAKFTFDNISTICIGNYIAGADSTATALSAVFYHLYKYPRTLEILRKEVDDHSADGRLSDPVAYLEGMRLPYLQAVIKEAMRVHPVFSMPMERIVPEGGVTVAGQYISEGVSQSVLLGL
jgi:cytochrome P450